MLFCVDSLVGLSLAMHYDWFMNFWLGGAAGNLPGFVLGTVWQLRSNTADRGWIGMACFLGFLAAVVTGEALFSVFPLMQEEMRNLSVANQLHTEDLQLIEVFDAYGENRIVRITDAESLKAFANGISDAVGRFPNHPVYSHMWYVVVKGTTQHEFELQIEPRFPQSVMGDFVVKSGNSTSCHGTFESKGLRTWVEAHLMSEELGGNKGN